MRILLTLLLLGALTVSSASTPDRKERKNRKNRKAQTEQPAPEPTVCPEEVQPAEVVQPAPPQPSPRMETADPDITPAQRDSLVAAWRERQALIAFEEYFRTFIDIEADSTATAGTSLPDSVYANRLYALVSPIPLAYNPVVKAHIVRYTTVHSGLIGRMLGLSQYYFPLIEDELIRAGLPVELRALPIIESALQPSAVSRAGAAGLWQFVPSTGKVYGLEVNSLIDERRDPVLSTRAACRYLKDLYGIYHDWTLALAAYNCGPGNVNKAIKRSGGKTFWEIYDYLPSETRGYVPAFIGATYAYAYHRQHGIEFTEAPLPLATDTVRVNRLLHLGQVASTIDVPIETLRLLNPQYRMDIIPATTKSYPLTLPLRSVTDYIEREQEIMAKDSAYLKEYINPANIDLKRKQAAPTQYYTVKRGDTLGAIARRYHVKTADLMRWNNIKNPKTLRIGQRLRIQKP